MRRFPNIFARFIIRVRFAVIIVSLAITAFFGWTIRELRIETDVGDFVPQKHPFLIVQGRLNEIFGGLNQVTIAIKVKNGDILNPVTLAKVHRMTSQLYLSEGINAGRVLSLAARRIKYTEPTPDGFATTQLMKTPPKTPEDIAKLKQKIISSPLVYGARQSAYGPIVSKDFTATLIQADFESGVSSRLIFQNLRKMVEAEEDENHEIFLAGRPMMEGWFDFYLPEMFKLFLITLVIMIILLFLAFRSKRGVILPMTAAVMSTIWGLGSLAMIGWRLNPGTILVPFLVMALTISHTVQFVKRYYERIARPRAESYRAAVDTLQSLLIPASASLITDALGFLSLLIVPIAFIRSMALAAGVGVLSIFVITVTFVPAVLSCLPKPREREIKNEEKITLLNSILGKLALVVTSPRGQAATLSAFGILMAFGAIGAAKLDVGDNEPGTALLYPDSPYNIAETYINDKFTGSNPYYILVEGKEDDALIYSEVLQEMESLQSHLVESIPQAGYALSLADYIKGLNFTMFDFDPAALRIPDNDKTIAEYMFLYTCTGFPEDFTPVVDASYRMANIKVDLKDHTADTIGRILQATRDWIDSHHKSDKVDFLFAGGEIGMTAAVNEIVAQMLPQNILQVAIMVFVCVSLAFGSAVAGLILLCPLIAGMLITFGVLGWLGLTLTVETLPVAALGMGLGIDYGIYIVTRLRGEFVLRRHTPLNEAIFRSLHTSGKAVFFTGVTLAIGVLAWIFSPIRLQARLGLMLGSIMLLNVLASLILLPCIVAIFRPKFIFSQKRW